LGWGGGGGVVGVGRGGVGEGVGRKGKREGLVEVRRDGLEQRRRCDDQVDAMTKVRFLAPWHH